MAIDIQKEVLLRLGQAARMLPTPPAPSTIWRWHSKGLNGIRLETVVVGGTRYTSSEAMGRFAAALTAASEQSADKPGQPDRDEVAQKQLRDAKLL